MEEKKASVVTSVGNASRDLRLVPEGITFGFVEEAIKTSSASLGNKEICKGYKYFSEKYIIDIRGRDRLLSLYLCPAFVRFLSFTESQSIFQFLENNYFKLLQIIFLQNKKYTFMCVLSLLYIYIKKKTKITNARYTCKKMIHSPLLI